MIENIAEINDIEVIQKMIKKPSNVVILSHRNPDGDAIGSSLAMRFFLEQFGHVCKVVLPSEYPFIFNFLPGVEDVIIYDDNNANAIDYVEKADWLICLDFNALDRIDGLEIAVSNSKAFTIMIDHHIDPEPFADWYLSDTSASSTCELVYHWISALGQLDKLQLDIATCLFTGLITDTGCFKYATNPNVYRIAASLKEIGVDDYSLNDQIFNNWTFRQLKILGHALRNRLRIYPDINTGIIFLDKKDYHKYQISRGDTEGIVNYILMMSGMKVAVFIREMPKGEIRLSLRSKGDISVQALARKYFNGGGHKNASGGSSALDLDATIAKVVDVVPEFLV